MCKPVVAWYERYVGLIKRILRKGLRKYGRGIIYHGGSVINKTLSRRESRDDTEGGCTLPRFHHAHRTPLSGGSPPSAICDADDGGNACQKSSPEGNSDFSSSTLYETHVAPSIFLLFLSIQLVIY